MKAAHMARRIIHAMLDTIQGVPGAEGEISGTKINGQGATISITARTADWISERPAPL